MKKRMKAAEVRGGLSSMFALAVATTVFAGCGTGGGGLGNHGNDSTGGGTGGNGGAPAGGSGNTNAGATGGQSFNFGGQQSGGSGGLGENECAATALAAEKKVEIVTDVITETVTKSTPAAIYILLDTSGSMAPFKWVFAVDAITQFVNDQRSEGLHLGLTYFPLPIPVSDCSGTSFSTPEVGWDVLGPPGAPLNQAIIDSLANHAPFGLGTPIEDALRGSIMGCQNFEAANAGIECYALLITDGEPSDCAQDAASLSAVAAQGLQNGVSTFAVGMDGADFAMLDQIAAAGNTDCNGAAAGNACNATDTAGFVAALNAIRESVTEEITTEVQREVETTVPLDCEWVAPTGQDADIDTANVDFTDRATGQKTGLGRVDSEAACAQTTELAWHFNADKTVLVACPATCDIIKAADAQIDIALGCEPRIIR